MDKKRCTAILLVAGSGSRMQSDTPKQFMLLKGKPLIWYALHTLERSAVIDDCILVARPADIDYVRDGVVKKYGFQKVGAVVAGGAERWNSVLHGLRFVKNGAMRVPNRDGYIFIHDGARPFLTEKILRDTYKAVQRYHACVAAAPSKDTVKIADGDGFVAATPDRRLVWNIQTPQVFDTELITDAYEKLWLECGACPEKPAEPQRGDSGQGRTEQDGPGQGRTEQGSSGQGRTEQDGPGQGRTGQGSSGQGRTGQGGFEQDGSGQGRTGQDGFEQGVPKQDALGRKFPPVTDDAGVVEWFTDIKVKLVEASCENIKITTPEDIVIAEGMLHYTGNC